ncbi:MAG: polyprenyl diphosphate synthase [Candidatus Paceibacterales bacterium]
MKKIPYHLGIILDGNRRWARERGLPAFEGHKRGLEKVKKVIKWCKNRGIKILTLFVFSTENWKRSKKEVNYLMRLAKKGISESLKEIHQAGIRIRVIGQKERVPESVQKTIAKAEELTKNNKEMVLNFALSYGGRTEIVQAIKNIIEKKIPPKKITEDIVSQNLWTSDLDLIIRTGKEQRLSNFLIWQAAYSELYFSKKYWPAFTEKDLDEILREYARRQRRFGGDPVSVNSKEKKKPQLT